MTSKTITDHDGDRLTVHDYGPADSPGHVTLHVVETSSGTRYHATVYVDARELRAALDEIAPVQEPGSDDPGPDGESTDDAAIRWMIRAKEEQQRALKAEKERDEVARYFRASVENEDQAVLRAKNAEQDRDVWKRRTGNLRRALDTCESNQSRTLTREQEEQIRLGRLVEMIRDGGGAVEVHGVKIAPCDTYGRTQDERAAAARTLAADDITDEMVGALRTHMWDVHDVDIDPGDCAEALRAALTEPRSRPEGAEGVATALLDADEAGFFNIAPRAIQDLADWLAAERGVRVVAEERS